MWKNYIALWAIITIGLLIFLLLSFLEADKMTNDVVRVGTFKRTLLAEKESTIKIDSIISSDSDVTAISQPDTSSHNILIIGDSMLEGLNKRLAAYAKANGHKLNSVIWYSSSTEYWGTCDTLKVFLKRFNPSYIFISLGGNEMFIRDIKTKRQKYIKNFLAQIGDIPYIWIGPPNWKPDTGINELIAENVKPGCFFLSNGMRFDRQKDGAHPTYESAAVWMDSIARWMPLHAAHPIKMEKPEAGLKAAPDHVVVLKPKHS